MCVLSRSLVGLAIIVLLPCIVRAAPFAYIGNISSNIVTVIDTATNAAVATVNVGEITTGVAVNSVGTRAYAANGQNVFVIDTATNKLIATVPFGITVGLVVGVAVNPAGTRLYVANGPSDTVAVIDTITNSVIANVGVGDTPAGIAVTPNGNRVYVANLDSDTVSVIDAATNAVVATIPIIGPFQRPLPFGIAVNPTGTRIYVANSNAYNSQDGNYYISVIDAATNTVVANVPSGQGGVPRGIAVNSAGTRVYTSNGAVIDAATNTLVASMEGGGLYGIAIDPNGTKVYIPSELMGAVRVIDTATNKIATSIAVAGRPFAFGQFIAPGAVPAGVTTVVEYHHTLFDHYFITPVATEIALLDARVPPFQEWSRTGYSFNVYAPATAPAGSVAICRFFNDHYAPKSSHFYAAHGFGCEATLAQFPDWKLEDDRLFNTMLPDSGSGACPAGTIPVYRLYNNGMGNAPNHRFVTSFAERQNMISSGWIAEGSGIGVGMCVPK
jgi:YVTN family beta-propeller protein